jgi:hypothetical protein
MPISKIKTSSILADAASTNLNIDAGTLFLDAANNRVGIGTTSPSNRLTVLAPVNTNSYAQITTSGTGSSYLGLTALGSTTNELSTNSAGDFVITSAGVASDVFKMVHTGAVTSTMVLKDGLVGIGTAAPVAELHVTTAGVASVPATTGTTLATGTLIRLGTSSDSAGGIGTIGLNTNQMWIQVTDSTNLAAVNALLLNPNGGNVGVGTTSPSAKFVVSNSGANGVEINPTGASITTYNRSTQLFTDMSTSSLSMSFNTGTSPTARVYIDSSGNVMVGNGTTASTSRLSISGGTNASQIRWEVNSAAFTQEVSTNAAQNAYAYKSNDASYHMWRLSSVEAMTLDASQNLCIGSAGVNNVFDQVSGSRPLVIQKSSTSTTLNGSTAAITIVNGATTTSNSAQLNFAAITGASTNQYSSAIISTIFGARTNGQYPTGIMCFSTSTTLNAAPTEKMRISEAGQVGIGTTATIGNATLNVNQGVVARTAAASSVTPYFQLYNGNASTDLKTWRIGGNTDGSMGFETVNDAYNSSAERLRITSAGVVEFPYGQIKFPATQNASANANTLDDYEEGNWTPNVNGSATGTFTVKVGTYVKIGKQVTIWFRCDSGVSGTGGATQYVDGLPFTVGTYSDSSMVGTMGTNGPADREQQLLTLSANRAVLYIYNGGSQEASVISYASGTATYWID